MEITHGQQTLVLHPSGAVYWPAQRALLVADLHFEKGSFFAEQAGQLLPPYDSLATLKALQALIKHYKPARVICLGDSFHDAGAAARLPLPFVRQLRHIAGKVDWLWLTGNHDPAVADWLPGTSRASLELDGLRLCHEPATDHPATLCGHLHPKISVKTHGRRLSARCFVFSERLGILPAFGQYTGGLFVSHAAFDDFIDEQTVYYACTRQQVLRFDQAQISAIQVPSAKRKLGMARG